MNSMQNYATKCPVHKSNIKYLWIAISYPHLIFILVKKSLLVLNTYALLDQPRNFLKNT